MAPLYTLLFFGVVASNAWAQVNDIQPPPPYVDPPEDPPASPYYDSVWAKVSPHVITECKTCPYALCPNKDFYSGQYMFRASCWATGQKINSTSTWLKSEDGCFVTEQDTLKYWRNYKDDIAYCGPVPEAVVPRKTTARQVADCRICPSNQCQVMKQYQRRNEVSITCQAQELPACLENCLSSEIPKPNATTIFPWYKTNDNCYVRTNEMSGARNGFRGTLRIRDGVDTSLNDNAGQQQPPALDICGPVPYLETSFRGPAPPIPDPFCATTTVSTTIIQPTTIIMRQPACLTCQPLIWGYTPPAPLATETRSATASNSAPSDQPPATIKSTTDPPITFPTSTLTLPPVIIPTSNTPIIITPTSEPPITLTPTSNPPITLTPTGDPPITLTPTSNPPITLPTSNLTLSPITPHSSSEPPTTLPPTTTTIPTLTPTSTSIITLTPTSTSIITLTPTSTSIITLTPTSTSIITLTPTSTSIITLTPTSTSIITLTPTSIPIITLTPTSIPPIILPTTNLTLPPITPGSASSSPKIANLNIQTTITTTAVSTTKPCLCQSTSCAGDIVTQRLCSQLASEACTRTCSLSSPSGDPFKPLMSNTAGGRPPPESPEVYLTNSISHGMKAACACPPANCPSSGDEASLCFQVWSAGCAVVCGNNSPATKAVWDSTTVLVFTQVITATPVA